MSITISAQIWEKILDAEVFGYAIQMEFDTDGNFFVAGSNGLFASFDSCQTFQSLYPTPTDYRGISSFLILEDSTIFISGSFFNQVSRDYGKSWQSFNDSILTHLNFFECDGTNNIYTARYELFKSTDDGESWVLLDDEMSIWSFYITNNGNLLAGTTCGIYLSIDEGLSWERTGSFDCGDVMAIDGTDNDEFIFICGEDRFHGVQYSTDQGMSWRLVPDSDTIMRCNSILTVSNSVFVGSYKTGLIKYDIRTLSSRKFDLGLAAYVTALALDSLGYLYVGSDGIYRTIEPVDSNKIKNIPEEINYNFYLKQNFPNPFNGETKIEFSLDADEKIKIYIYDVLGRLVERLVEKEFLKGIHEVSFKSKNYSSGVYYYVLQTKSRTESRKMLILK